MTDETIDHQARKMAEQALSRLDDHIRVSSDNHRLTNGRLDRLENDLKQGFDTVRESIGRVHTRLDTLIRTMFILIVGIAVSLLGGILWFFATNPPNP